jgi:Leucine-rich repeat (LRR) protein
MRRPIEKVRWLVFRVELRLRERIRLRGARTCQSLEEASRRPLSVGRLSLRGFGAQRNPIPSQDGALILAELRNLQELDLGWQPWTALPLELSRCQRLREVVVLNMPIREFPTLLGHCPALQELTLRGTDIVKLPDGASGFDSLRFLDLSNNDIAAIPNWVHQLPRLRELKLHDTRVPSCDVVQLRRSLPSAIIFWSGRRRPLSSRPSVEPARHSERR